MAEQPKQASPGAVNVQKRPPGKSQKGSGPRPDFATVCGIFVALGGIVGGLLMEGGKIRDVRRLPQR